MKKNNSDLKVEDPFEDDPLEQAKQPEETVIQVELRPLSSYKEPSPQADRLFTFAILSLMGALLGGWPGLLTGGTVLWMASNLKKRHQDQQDTYDPQAWRQLGYTQMIAKAGIGLGIVIFLLSFFIWNPATDSYW